MVTLARSLKANGVWNADDPENPAGGNAGPAIFTTEDGRVLVERVEWRGRDVWHVARYDKSWKQEEIFAGRGTYLEIFTCLYWQEMIKHITPMIKS